MGSRASSESGKTTHSPRACSSSLITHSREAFIFGVVEDVDVGCRGFLVVVGDDVGGVIGGSVDHDEQFKVGVCLVSDGLYGVDDGVWRCCRPA